jgi:uncharacterized membrane protein/GT2 family glycosyltransferase
VSKKLPLISVVVCSFNGADVISDALKAIKAQKWAGKLEIIVVDDGSTDDTYKIAKSFKGIKVIKKKQNRGIAGSRNTGIKAAKGEIIAFTNDDCRPRPTWIKELYAGYTSDKILGVGGEVISSDKSSLTLRYLNVNQPLKPLENKILKSKKSFYRFTSYLKGLTGLSRPTPNRKRSVYSLTTANVSFRKSVLKKIGMFDERFIFAGEDVDLCKRLNNTHPESLWFAPKAKVIHQYDSRLKDTLRRSKARAVGTAQLSRKHKDFKVTPYPFPLLIPLTILLGLINPWFLLTPFALVLVIYSQGIRLVIKRSLEPLIYGYIQFAQEWYSNLGLIKGWWKFRNTFRETVPRSKPLIIKKTKTTIDNSFTSTKFNFSISATQDITVQKPKRNKKFLSEAAIIALILGLVLIATLVKSSTIFHIPSAIAIILTSGYLLLRGFRAESERRLPGMLRLSLMVTFGIAWIMFFGLIADIILPIFGFKHPLTSAWLPLIFVVATGLLIPWSLRFKIAAKKVTPRFKPNWDTVVLSGLLILMISFSFCGARLLNNDHTDILAILAFVVGLVSIVFAVVRRKFLPKNMFPVVLFVLSLASVWSYSLRSNYVFGWDIQQEFHVFQTTLASGKWALGAKHSAYDAMLSLTILPVTIAKVTGMAGLTIYKFLSPLLFSFVPVIIYYIYCLFTKRWISFLAALLIIAQFCYMQQFSALVRQQIAFLFFASILYVILQNRLSHRTKNYLLVSFILGLVVSHYSTTYLSIIFFGGTYIVSKIVFALLQRYKHKETEYQDKYIHGWIVVVLIVSAFLWYGPATHSSGFLQKLTRKHDYSQIIQNTENTIRRYFNNHSYAPKTTEAYLQTVGNHFHEQHKNLIYYSGASNSSIHPMLQPTIKARLPLLMRFVDGLGLILRGGWWLLGGAGILALIFSAYRVFGYRRLELGILGAIGIIAYIAINFIPTFGIIYNASRLKEQVLMFTALPSILILIWLLRSLSTRAVRSIVVGLVLISFAMASGIITQFVGGTPTANLNNFGDDYNKLYVQQSNIASAQWLAHYSSYNLVYDDTYSGLRLTSATNTIHGQIPDVTPETISLSSFVYANYANVRLGIATTEIKNERLSYQFPTSFLQQNKNLVYSSGNSEVYK